MQLHYLLVVIVVSDVSDGKVMSSTVAVISAITRVVSRYNIQTKRCFLSRTKQNLFQTESNFFKKPNGNKKSILHIPSNNIAAIPNKPFYPFTS